MSFYIDMTSVLDTFKTEIKVISNSSSGDWIDGHLPYKNWIELELKELFNRLYSSK